MFDALKVSGSRNEHAREIHLCGERVPHPGHVCAFFDSREQKYATLGPFLIDAIAAGDRVINIVDERGRKDHLKALAAAHVPVTYAAERGQLKLLTSEETYLREGEVSLDPLLDLLRHEMEAAKHEDRCIRTWGDMNWIGRSRMPIERVLEYEANVNRFMPDFTCTLLCVYDLAFTASALVSDILATHPFAIIKGRLRENPYFVKPDEYLRMLRANLSKRNGAVT